MLFQENKTTKTWILRHPAQVRKPPLGYRQVELVQSVPDFEQARNVVAKLSWVQQESISRRKAVHYSTRDYYTLIEMPESASADDVVHAFFEGGDVRREFIS